jgi:hypothetical protein
MVFLPDGLCPRQFVSSIRLLEQGGWPGVDFETGELFLDRGWGRELRRFARIPDGVIENAAASWRRCALATSVRCRASIEAEAAGVMTSGRARRP